MPTLTLTEDQASTLLEILQRELPRASHRAISSPLLAERQKARRWSETIPELIPLLKKPTIVTVDVVDCGFRAVIMVPITEDDLPLYNINTLRAVAKFMNIQHYGRATKGELIHMILAADIRMHLADPSDPSDPGVED